MAAMKGCLFDLDGLLLDTEPLHGAAWRAAVESFGGSVEDATLLQMRGRNRQDCARLLVEHCQLPIHAEALIAAQQPIARGQLGRAAPMDGAPELLAHCRRGGLAMALATSSSRESLALKLANHSWLGVITARITGDHPDLPRGKPAPDIFLLAAAALALPAEDCWAFEDSPTGCRAAVAAGCRVVVLMAPGAREDDYPGASHLVRYLSEIPALLRTDR